MFSYPLDSAMILKKKKSLKKQFLSDNKLRIRKKIAILGGSTTNDIVDMLELFLLDYGIEPEFYQSNYGQYWQDAMFTPSKFFNFNPDIIFIHTTNRNIKWYPSITSGSVEIDNHLKEEFAHFHEMWERLFEIFKCPIIQNNFELPFFRILGNKDFSDIHGRINYINRLNSMFADYTKLHDNFFINDINYISSCYGLEKWSNPFFWNMYKYALAVPAIPEFSFNLSNIIKSIFGKNKKVMALDLDNTLWGGVIGDDGVEGIVIGPEMPIGEAFSEFQSYIKAHKNLGVLLTVSSKNDLENALKGLNHSAGILKPEDFLVIKANWESKDINIREIAAELNIFPESIVFIDDNPNERDIVKAQIGDIAAPELFNIENYIIVIDRNGYFEVTNFSEDDAARNEMYMQNNLRNTYKAQFSNYGEYLDSLNMKAEIKKFAFQDLQRITQLTNKSNQFNLTTKRYTALEIEYVATQNNYLTLCGRLSDKFGDNGIVSIIIAKKRKTELHIDLWLMSCRVLKRDMEFAMIDTLAAEAAACNICTIYGYFYPSGKNAMVQDLYSSFGFEQISEDVSGNTVWRLRISDYTAKSKHIVINDN